MMQKFVFSYNSLWLYPANEWEGATSVDQCHFIFTGGLVVTSSSVNKTLIFDLLGT